MNINTNFPNVSLVTGNPATISVVRENELRPMIPASRGATEGAAEKAVAGEQEKVQPTGVTVQLSGSYELTAAEEAEQSAADSQQSEGEEGNEGENGEKSASDPEQDKESSERDKGTNPQDLTEEELQQVEALKDRHEEVVRHEEAHAAVGGQYAGAPSYDYQTGPDNKRYAVGGEVMIDTSEVANDPEATLRKADQIRAAALAPAEPSSQDRRVAAQADAMAAKARQEMASEVNNEKRGVEDGSNNAALGDNESSAERDTLAADKPAGRALDKDDEALMLQMQQRNAVISQRYQNAYGGGSPGQLVGRV